MPRYTGRNRCRDADEKPPVTTQPDSDNHHGGRLAPHDEGGREEHRDPPPQTGGKRPGALRRVTRLQFASHLSAVVPRAPRVSSEAPIALFAHARSAHSCTSFRKPHVHAHFSCYFQHGIVATDRAGEGHIAHSPFSNNLNLDHSNTANEWQETCLEPHQQTHAFLKLYAGDLAPRQPKTMKPTSDSDRISLEPNPHEPGADEQESTDGREREGGGPQIILEKQEDASPHGKQRPNGSCDTHAARRSANCTVMHLLPILNNADREPARPPQYC